MLYLLAASILWSFSFGMIKKHLAELDPFSVSAIRLAISCLVFLPFFKAIQPNRMLPLCLIGAMQFGVMYCLYISSYHYFSGNEIAILTLATPLWVLLIEAFQKRQLNLTHWTAGVLAIFGALVVVEFSEFQQNLVGLVLIQLANFSFALGFCLYKWFQNKHNGPVSQDMFWLYLGAALVPIAIMIVNREISWLTFGNHQWLALLFLGAIPSGLGFFLWNKGVSCTELSLAAVMNDLKVPLGVLVAFLVFKEQVAWWRIALSLILTSTAIIMVKRVK